MGTRYVSHHHQVSSFSKSELWNLSHVRAFNDQPFMPDKDGKVFDNDDKVNVLCKLIDAAEIWGFARVEIELTPE
jgi:hypothetical protein